MNIAITSFIVFIMIVPVVSIVDATPIHIVIEDSEARPIPIAFTNFTPASSNDYLTPTDMCVSNTGITFTVNMNPLWEIIRGPTATAFVAWNRDGSVRWSIESWTWGRPLLGVATDDTYVYATGRDAYGPYLGKYDYQGIRQWNATWDFGSNGKGREVIVTDDGTIVVVGDSYNSSLGNCLVAFDSGGQELWYKMFTNQTSLSSSSNSIYTLCNGTIQKYQTNGDLVWSTDGADGSYIRVMGDIVYTVNRTVRSGFFSEPSYRHYLNVTRFDGETGEELWTSGVGFYNTNQRKYNCTSFDFTVDPTGAFVVLMQLYERESWYLSRIASNGTALNSTNLLDNSWQVAKVVVEDNGYVHVSGEGTDIGLAFALFNASLIPVEIPIPLNLDFLFVGVVIAGVAIFDIGLILYLKKKHPS